MLTVLLELFDDEVEAEVDDAVDAVDVEDDVDAPVDDVAEVDVELELDDVDAAWAPTGRTTPARDNATAAAADTTPDSLTPIFITPFTPDRRPTGGRRPVPQTAPMLPPRRGRPDPTATMRTQARLRSYSLPSRHAESIGSSLCAILVTLCFDGFCYAQWRIRLVVYGARLESVLV